MWTIWMEVNNQWWPYGTYADRDRANEIAMQVRDQRNIPVCVEPAEQ